MSTIIRASDKERGVQQPAFNFDDLAAQAERYLAQVRSEAAKIVAKAKQDAEVVRKQAEQQGRQAAMQSVETVVQKQLATVLPALKQAVQDISHARQAWLKHWETSAVHVAAAIAKKVIQRELAQEPEISRQWLREALELSAAAGQLRVHLHPDDYKSLGAHREMLTSELKSLASVEWIANGDVTRGGCRVETRFGAIDTQVETQLARIEEELRG